MYWTVVSLNPSTTKLYRSSNCLIAVLPDDTINLEVFGFLGFALDTCAIHLPHAGDLVL